MNNCYRPWEEEIDHSLLEDMTPEQITAAAGGIEGALKTKGPGKTSAPTSQGGNLRGTVDPNSDLVRRIQADYPSLTESEIREAIGSL